MERKIIRKMKEKGRGVQGGGGSGKIRKSKSEKKFNCKFVASLRTCSTI